MKVSVLIPTIDRLHYLAESLDSARHQTYGNIEILVSDDSPTRGGVREEVLAISRADPRVRLLETNPRRGLYENYNHLIQHATGDAFGILDDDDRWLPGMVSTLVEPLKDNRDVVATFCDHWIISAGGVRLPAESDLNSKRFGRHGLPTGAIDNGIEVSARGGLSTVFALFRTSSFKDEAFDIDCAGAADLDYAIRGTTATKHAWMIRGVVKALEKHTFSEPAQEQLRRELLAERYRILMVYTCTRNRAVWWRSLRKYFAIGGNLLDPFIALSVLLASLPNKMGEALRRKLKGVRTWLTSTSPPAYDDPRSS